MEFGENQLTLDTMCELPKADIHMHPETGARVERLLSRREGRRPFDWREWQR